MTAWKGTAFGGGAYFEATFSFNPADVNNVSGAHGWPSFWADPVEHGAEQSVFSDNWVGQANGFVHFLEMDFFEYNVWGYDNKLFAYNGTVIDWSGVYVTGSAAGYPVHLQNTYNRQITVPSAPTSPNRTPTGSFGRRRQVRRRATISGISTDAPLRIGFITTSIIARAPRPDDRNSSPSLWRGRLLSSRDNH